MKKIFAALLMTVAFAVPAFAQMHDKESKGHKECACHEQHMEKRGMHRHGHMLGMLIMHADKFGLSDDQVTKLKGIQRATAKRMIQLEADKKIARIDLMEIMAVKDFDLEKANTVAQKISDIQKDKRLEKLKAIKEVRNVLTDEQFKKTEEMKRKMMGGKKPEMKKHDEKK